MLGTDGDKRLGDVIFKNLAVGSGMLVTAVIFLMPRSSSRRPCVLFDNKANFFTYQGQW